MAKALIKLAYRQVIDINSESDFEKNVFHASYQEFLLKSQAYNPEQKFKTFAALKQHDGRANSLHYKLGFAVGNFIGTLNNTIPLLCDNAGRGLKFEVPRFELIASDITNKTDHKIAINYCTGIFTLLNIAGEYLVLAAGDATDQQTVETFTLKMQPELSIVFYKDLLYSEHTPVNRDDACVAVNIGNI